MAMTEKTRNGLAKALRDRDGGWRCHWCRGHGKTLDHLVPQSLGGVDDLYNLVLACVDCNSRRGNRLPDCGHMMCDAAVYRQKVNNPMLAAVILALANA